MEKKQLHDGCNSKFLFDQSITTTLLFVPILKQSTICQIFVRCVLCECGSKGLQGQLSFDLEHLTWFVATGGGTTNPSIQHRLQARIPLLMLVLSMYWKMKIVFQSTINCHLALFVNSSIISIVLFVKTSSLYHCASKTSNQKT